MIRGFNVQSPPFWAHTVAESADVLYENILVNATNTDPTFSGQKYEILVYFPTQSELILFTVSYGILTVGFQSR